MKKESSNLVRAGVCIQPFSNKLVIQLSINNFTFLNLKHEVY